jgi:hypothetical protein
MLEGRADMKALGIALAVFGVVALIYGVVGYDRQTTVIDIGGIKATATEHKSVPIAPIVGGVSLIGGVALLMASKRRS